MNKKKERNFEVLSEINKIIENGEESIIDSIGQYLVKMDYDLITWFWRKCW